MAVARIASVADVFPVTSIVGAYLPFSNSEAARPPGSQLDVGIVQGDGSLTFTALPSWESPYAAWDGRRVVGFRTPGDPASSSGGGTVVDPALSARVTALEQQVPAKLGAREDVDASRGIEFVGNTWTARWAGKTRILVLRGRLTVPTVLDPIGLFPSAELLLYVTQPATGGCTVTIPNQAGPIEQWLSTAPGATSFKRFVCPNGAELWADAAPGAVQGVTSVPMSVLANTPNAGS